LEVIGARQNYKSGIKYKEKVIGELKRMNISVIDIEVLFSSHPRISDLFHSPILHYTEAGYKLIADELEKIIRPENGVKRLRQ
jgi:hypothetical protein